MSCQKSVWMQQALFLWYIFAASSSGKKKELIAFDDRDVVKKYNMSESDVKVRQGLFNQ